MDLPALKKKWRKTLKSRRMKLEAEEISALSERIFTRWNHQFSLEQVQYLHLFLSMDRFNEVETASFRAAVERSAHPTKILVPVMDMRNTTLQHFELEDEIRIEKNTFGVPEPRVRKRPVPPSKIDMVIVPMLGFDDHGHRLGYGKGYYDRFLSQLRPDCPKIGVCFELGHLSEPLPSEPHDVPLNFVITEEKVYDFSATK